MKVKELISILSTKDPEMRVIVSGYECGYDELNTVKTVNIQPNTHKFSDGKDEKWWEGDFQETFCKNCESAILLPRKP